MVRLLLSVLCWCVASASQAPPKVVSMTPRNGGTVAPGVTELVVTFDQDMSRRGYSVCGGGPAFPKIEGRPKWPRDRKLVIPVRLQPDHEYELSLNCASARKIQSKAGTSLTPTKWSFTTLPAKLRPWPEQQQRNRDAFDRLQALLQSSYAYRDRVVADWAALLGEQGARLLQARTDRAFAKAAAALLEAARDQHVSVRYKDRVYATEQTLVEPLYRTFATRRLFDLEQVSTRVFRGSTDDGIGYLMITGWQADVDPERLLGAIAEMMSMKALILDVRPNLGGDEQIARRVASWFVKGEKVYAKHQSIGPNGLGEVQERKVVGNEETFSRPTVVLTGPRVMSSCESFVLMMKQADGVQIVGQKTRGSSGNPVEHDLGNGVRVQLPSWRALRPDGSCFEGEGIQPDVHVPCTSRDLQEGEPTLHKALELLRQRIK
ncbi:MAG: S41 family peptidase [Planctomycetota bacterium]|nr:S41 family peptidase [Planctomycetota bacterium]